MQGYLQLAPACIQVDGQSTGENQQQRKVSMKIKSIPPLLVCLLLLMAVTPAAFMSGGCASSEQAAYRSVGVVESTVHNAMLGWGRYVQSGKATANEIVAVQKHYEKYQAAMAAVESAALSATNTPEGQSALETALKAAEAATGEIIALIEALSRN